MRITEEILNQLFKEEGLKFEHDDEMRKNANYYWVSSEEYPGVCLRVYAGAEEGGNLVNRYSVNDQFVSGVLCLDVDAIGDFVYDDEEDVDREYQYYLYDNEYSYLYFNDILCVAYVDQENVTPNGYLDFHDDIGSIRKVAEEMYRQLSDAVAR